MALGVEAAGLQSTTLQAAVPHTTHQMVVDVGVTGGGSAPPSGVTQEVLCPFLEGEQEQSEDDCLEADCAAPFIHYEP